MRRLLALFIAVVLLLTGCGRTSEQPSVPIQPTQPVVKIPTFADCGKELGMISHKSISKYSYFESDEIVSTRNLLFVPAGTTISSESSFAVYPYTANNVLDTDQLQATGQNVMNEYLVVMAEGTVTLDTAAYLRVSVSGSLSDLTVTYPEGKSSEARVIDNDYEAYGKDYDRILEELKTVENGAMNYIFITDIHYDKGVISNVQAASLKKQIDLVVQMANESDAIDFVAVGGDITSGNQSSKQKTSSRVTEILDPLKKCKKPVFVLMGNHDDNSYCTGETVYSDDMAASLVSKKNWNDLVLKAYAPPTIVHDSQDENSAYYYYDFPDKKVRTICLDAIDYPQQVDENGTIIASSLELNDEGNSKNGRSYWGYHARQLKWLINEALTAEEGWNYVFLSHMSASAEYYGKDLKELLAAFQNRTVYENDEVGTADFTQASGRVMVFHHGHSHSNKVTLLEGLGVWQILTGTANISQLSNNSVSSSNYRGFGTEDECCFDVVSATATQVLKYGFGWPDDEKLATPQ